jgi:N-acetyl-1-D-myo-inositol-2-amino-2-deoxy-alpha-D-glucopyranoside deacetylase
MEQRMLLVHAHPDDESINQGATMAKYVARGAKVTLVTCTLGEEGEVLIPELEHIAAHRDDTLGRHRITELANAMKELGVTDHRFLGGAGRFRDSGMVWHEEGHAVAGEDVKEGTFWRADLLEASTYLVEIIREVRPQVLVTYDEFGGYGHPDHIRVHDVTVRAVPRAGDASWYQEQLETGLEPWAPAKLYEQAIPKSSREAMNRRFEELGIDSFWLPPKDATPDQLAEFEVMMSKMLVPDELVTTRIDVSAQLELKWQALRKHETQMADDFPFIKLGYEGWRELWSQESFILRESRVRSDLPETDLFAGLG